MNFADRFARAVHRQIERRAQLHCDGCETLRECKSQLSTVRENALKVAEDLSVAQKTNLELGSEMERLGKEAAKSKADLQKLEKGAEHLEKRLDEKRADCRTLWEEKKYLLSQNRAYRGLLRLDELHREPMRSRSNRRQHPREQKGERS